MNLHFKQHYYHFILIFAMVFFGGSIIQWKRAQLPQTYIREKAVPNHYLFTGKEPVFPVERYIQLFQGELFFGKPPEGSEPEKPIFSSGLMVLGITQGITSKDGYAVVSMTSGSEEETLIVKEGMVIAGETILKITEKGIMIKNTTGVGTINLQ
jgi:hypothetical protein